jgi:hypothetical protein
MANAAVLSGLSAKGCGAQVKTELNGVDLDEIEV